MRKPCPIKEPDSMTSIVVEIIIPLVILNTTVGIISWYNDHPFDAYIGPVSLVSLALSSWFHLSLIHYHKFNCDCWKRYHSDE